MLFPENSSPTTPNSLQLSDTPTNPETESRFAEIELDNPVIITDSNEPKNFEISVPRPPEDPQQYLPIKSSTTSNPATQRVSNRTHYKPRRFWETIDLPDPPHNTILACALITTEEDEPHTNNQAISCSDAPKWFQAMQEELDILIDQNVWTIVLEPKNRNIVDCRWVYKIKRHATGNITRYKARLVAKGFLQQAGTDFNEIFSQVVYYDSLRLLIALSLYFNWSPDQLDIKGTLLYCYLKDEIHMKLPDGYQSNGQCARLNRSIYGFKQLPKAWYEGLTTYLLPLGYTVSSFDPCVVINLQAPSRIPPSSSQSEYY